MGCVCRVAFAPLAWGGVYDVKDYGAKGDGVTKDTAAIQRAIDAAEAAGGGTVEVPAGRYLTGSIFLKDNIDLHVGAGAVLFGSPDRADYNAPDVCAQNWSSKYENASGGHLILAIEKRNVTVRGPGLVDGNSAAFLLDPKTGDNWPEIHRGIPWRTSQMMYFVECEGVRVEDLRIENSPYWSCFLHGCRKAQLRGLQVRTPRKPRTWNGDGIDIDCCQDVTISDCIIETDDDCITLRGDPKLLKRKQDCARITVANCVLSSVCNAVRIGVGDGVVRDATFSNLVVHDTKTAFHLVSGYSKGRGTDISNVRFENIQADCRVFCRVRHGFATGARIGNVTFSGVSGRTTDASIVWANSARPFGRIVFDGVNLEGPGVEVVSAPDVRFVDSSLAPISFSDAERMQRVSDVDACRVNLW